MALPVWRRSRCWRVLWSIRLDAGARRWPRGCSSSGTLFPVLGFLNVYPFIFSFVADHFQYLASLGMIVLFASGATLAAARLPERARWVGNVADCLLVAILAWLTWRQCGMYGDLDTLYQTTIDRNPNCSMAYNNLGVHVAKDQLDDTAATALIRRALELKPTFADAHYNLANALVRAGDRPEAIREFNEAASIAASLRGCGEQSSAICSSRWASARGSRSFAAGREPRAG